MLGRRYCIVVYIPTNLYWESTIDSLHCNVRNIHTKQSEPRCALLYNGITCCLLHCIFDLPAYIKKSSFSPLIDMLKFRR